MVKLIVAASAAVLSLAMPALAADPAPQPPNPHQMQVDVIKGRLDQERQNLMNVEATATALHGLIQHDQAMMDELMLQNMPMRTHNERTPIMPNRTTNPPTKNK